VQISSGPATVSREFSILSSLKTGKAVENDDLKPGDLPILYT